MAFLSDGQDAARETLGGQHAAMAKTSSLMKQARPEMSFAQQRDIMWKLFIMKILVA
jgi:hypothetical protein